MRFSAKRFALEALSAYYNHTEIVKRCHMIFKMPNFSKGHNSGYKVAFPIAIFTRGKFYHGVGEIRYFPGGNSTTGKLHSHFFAGGGGGF